MEAPAGELVRSAARNNAEWCDIVCRLHGRAGSYHDGGWSVSGRPPPFYPDAVTLEPTANVEAILAAIDTSPGCSVKDSFACLDLRPEGFEVLFEARWIHRAAGSPPESPVTMRWEPVRDPALLEEWERAWKMGAGAEGPFLPALLEDDSVLVLAGYRDDAIEAGAIANGSGAVVGVSNLFSASGDLDATWSGAVAAVTAHVGDVPLVGYEQGDDLDAACRCGFSPLDPLRVWTRPA